MQGPGQRLLHLGVPRPGHDLYDGADHPPVADDGLAAGLLLGELQDQAGGLQDDGGVSVAEEAGDLGEGVGRHLGGTLCVCVCVLCVYMYVCVHVCACMFCVYMCVCICMHV